MRELWAEHPSHPLWSLMTSSVAKQVLKSSCEGTECTVFLQIIKVFNPRCLNISDAASIHIWNTKYHTRMLLFLLMSCLKKGCKEHVLMIKATINGWSQGCLKVSCFLLKKIVIKAKVIVGICGFSFSSVIFTFVIHWPSPICLISKMRFITLTFSFYTLELKVYVSGKLFFFFLAKSSYEFHSPINWPLWVFTLIPGEWDIVGYCGFWPDLWWFVCECEFALLITAWTNESRYRHMGVRIGKLKL